jgi:glycosyltransferase involved in cell wall biosynthesis
MANYSKKKLCFFLSRIETHFQGDARPFINWAIELPKEEYEIDFILHQCGKEIGDFIKTNVSNVHLNYVESFKETLRHLDNSKPDLLISDDYFSRLKFITKLKEQIQIKTFIYVQILFGFHSIADAFDLRFLSLKHKMIFGATRCLPFYFFKIPYRKLLLKHDLVAANSNIAATLLHILYGVEPLKVIYPPVDTTHFKFYEGKEKNQALIYVGSFGGDTDEDLIRKICKVLRDKKFNILIFGNKNILEKLKSEFIVYPLSGITDEELARIYSETNLVVCPQKWETFGYTVAESICCGTPVLAFNCMGTGEILSQVNSEFLVDNEKDFLNRIEAFTLKESSKDNATYPWDISYSTRRLNSLLNQYLNRVDS